MPRFNDDNELDTVSGNGEDKESPRNTLTESPARLSEETSPSNSQVNLEDAFSNIFKQSVSGTGEEELLRIASDYALQISAAQIKCLIYLKYRAEQFLALAKRQPKYAAFYQWQAGYLSAFVDKWLDLKKHNNSDIFVMRALDSISLRKFINENTLKVNIEK